MASRKGQWLSDTRPGSSHLDHFHFLFSTKLSDTHLDELMLRLYHAVMSTPTFYVMSRLFLILLHLWGLNGIGFIREERFLIISWILYIFTERDKGNERESGIGNRKTEMWEPNFPRKAELGKKVWGNSRDEFYEHGCISLFFSLHGLGKDDLRSQHYRHPTELGRKHSGCAERNVYI